MTRRPFLLALAFLSGAAGLSYELSWTHGLTLVAGNSTRAVAFILAGFLGGMALGGAFAGRRVFARVRPLRAIAIAEVILALVALAWPRLWNSFADGLAALVRSGVPVEAARALVVAAALIPPALLLGATFPWWVRALEPPAGDDAARGRTVALVAGVQVAGAAAGALIAGFVVVPQHGFAVASWCGAAVDALVALAAWLAAGPRGALPATSAPASRDSSPGLATAPDAASAPFRRFSFAFVVAGAASIGLQALWTRCLGFFSDGLHFAFAAVVAVYLAGLGAGALLVAALAPRVRRPEAWLSFARSAGALTAVAGLALVPLVIAPQLDAARSSPAWRGWIFLAAAELLFVPATLIGTTLPLASWIALRGGSDVGASCARAYGSVTAGNALGALLVPLAIVPALGVRATFGALAAADAVAALLLATTRRVRAAAAAALVVALAALGWSVAVPRPLILDSHVFRGRAGADRELVAARDGVACEVAVVEDRRRRTTTLYTDAFAAAATGREYPYMRLLGHLPVLACAKPERALVICFGTGTTAGAVSLHPEVRELRVVDVEREVFAAAPYFRSVNLDVLGRPRDPPVQRAVEDGRLDLRLSAGPWDVITLEPLLPYTPGAATLYSADFYRLARERLREGGTICQWLPVHAVPVDSWRALARTFLEVFADGEIFFFEQSVLLWARKGGEPPRWEEFAARARRPAILESLAEALVSGPEDLLAARVSGAAAARAPLGDAAIVTDDFPHPIFLRELPLGRAGAVLAETLGVLVRCGKDDLEPPGGSVVADVPPESRAAIGALRDLRLDLLEERRLRAADQAAAARDPSHRGWRADLAIGRVLAAASAHPGHLEARRLVERWSFQVATGEARAALAQGRPMEAFAALARFQGFAEWETGPESLLATALVAAGDGDGARLILDRTLAGHPRDVEALITRAAAWQLLGRGNESRAGEALARDIDAARADRQAAFVQEARAAARSSGLPPLAPLRERLRGLVAPDLLRDPDALIRAQEELSRASAAGLLPLLAHPWMLVLEGDARGRDEILRAGRALALLGVARAEEPLKRVEDAAQDAAVREACRRARAALVPRAPEAIAALLASEDVVTRRLLAAFAATRGGAEIAPELLRGLEDADADVRLYTDRALRRLSGKTAGFDAEAPPAERADAIARWRALLAGTAPR